MLTNHGLVDLSGLTDQQVILYKKMRSQFTVEDKNGLFFIDGDWVGGIDDMLALKRYGLVEQTPKSRTWVVVQRPPLIKEFPDAEDLVAAAPEPDRGPLWGSW
jgi:hypothetical protein